LLLILPSPTPASAESIDDMNAIYSHAEGGKNVDLATAQSQ
jgi:hypothetical protein